VSLQQRKSLFKQNLNWVKFTKSWLTQADAFHMHIHRRRETFTAGWLEPPHNITQHNNTTGASGSDRIPMRSSNTSTCLLSQPLQ
jgi:hypothetical protein